MSDSDAVDKDIKAKLNLHLKKRIKQTNAVKRKVESQPEDTEASEGTSKKRPGKGKGKKSKIQSAEEEDSGDVPEAPQPQKVSTMDVLQLLLNEKKRSLIMDSDVINYIRSKQGHRQ